MTTTKLRLGPLPKTECQADLRLPGKPESRLDRYASLHAQAYGEAVDAEKLIPHMLEAFMAGIGDSGRARRPGARHRSRHDGVTYQRHPSNAQPPAARSSFWMPPSLLGYDDATGPPFLGNPARHGAMRLLSRRSYVAPSRRSRGSAKRPRKELTYCPIYGFKPCVICAKDLTPALFVARAPMLHGAVDGSLVLGRHGRGGRQAVGHPGLDAAAIPVGGPASVPARSAAL